MIQKINSIKWIEKVFYSCKSIVINLTYKFNIIPFSLLFIYLFLNKYQQLVLF